MKDVEIKRKGITSVAEAILVGGLIALILSIFASYTLGYLSVGKPTIKQSTIDATLCGRVLIIKNTGKVDVKITDVKGTSPLEDLSTELNLPVTLEAGHSLPYQLNKTYDMVVITGEGFTSVSVKNDCLGGGTS